MKRQISKRKGRDKDGATKEREKRGRGDGEKRKERRGKGEGLKKKKRVNEEEKGGGAEGKRGGGEVRLYLWTCVFL